MKSEHEVNSFLDALGAENVSIVSALDLHGFYQSDAGSDSANKRMVARMKVGGLKFLPVLSSTKAKEVESCKGYALIDAKYPVAREIARVFEQSHLYWGDRSQPLGYVHAET